MTIQRLKRAVREEEQKRKHVATNINENIWAKLRYYSLRENSTISDMLEHILGEFFKEQKI